MPCSSPVASGTWRISKDGALTRRVSTGDLDLEGGGWRVDGGHFCFGGGV